MAIITQIWAVCPFLLRICKNILQRIDSLGCVLYNNAYSLKVRNAMALYFSYGMNTNREQMAVRCPDARPIGHATLAGHKLRFAGCADIVPSAAHQVDGVLWEITPQCRTALDALEGFPSFYSIKTVMVKHRRRCYTAEVYYMVADSELWQPSPQYYDIIAAGYRTFGVPVQQLSHALSEVCQSNLTRALSR